MSQTEQALKSLGLDLKTRSRLRSPSLVWVTADWVDWLRAFLIRSPRLDIPVIGYGLRYEFGIFRQEIVDGWQIEKSDKWLQFGNPWEIPASISMEVGLFGHTETYTDDKGTIRHRWVPGNKMKGIPFDTPIPG